VQDLLVRESWGPRGEAVKEQEHEGRATCIEGSSPDELLCTKEERTVEFSMQQILTTEEATTIKVHQHQEQRT
jgi:hypothetical protein